MLQLWQQCQDASRDKEQIIEQLFALQKVLEDVRALVEDGQANTTSRLPALIALLKTPDGLPHLESLKAQLQPKGGRVDCVQVLVWPLKEGDVRKKLDYLGRFQQSLGLALNVDQT